MAGVEEVGSCREIPISSLYCSKRESLGKLKLLAKEKKGLLFSGSANVTLFHIENKMKKGGIRALILPLFSDFLSFASP